MEQNGVSVELKGLKEINQMFMQLPKQLDQDKIWAKFWRKNSKPLVDGAKSNAPTHSKDIPYPPNKSLMIKPGTLKKSLGFFRTKKSKEVHGGYVGPRVKGAFKKNKGGYYGAWVEYGNEVMHYGKFKGKSNPFMKKAFSAKKDIVVAKGMKDAEIIFARSVKIHEKRIQKYGKLGY